MMDRKRARIQAIRAAVVRSCAKMQQIAEMYLYTFRRALTKRVPIFTAFLVI